MNHTRKHLNSRRSGRGKNATSEYNAAVDRSRPLGDGTVGTPLDRFDRKLSSMPPTTIPRDITRQGYWYKGSVALTSLTANSSLPVSAGYSFKFSDLPLSSALANVFDEYAIVQVVARVFPSLTQSTASTSTLPILQTVIDHDDALSLPSGTAANEYASCLETNGTVGHTRVIRPKIAVAAYGGSVFSSYANARSYIDAASPGVPHFGLKVLVSASTQAIVYTVVADYYVHLRDTH